MSHDKIIEAYEAYLKESEAFETKGIKAAAARARKALGELGKLAKSFMDKGELVPDEVTIQMLESEVNKYNDSNGFIFDGFPRTTQQADALDKYLHSIGTEVTKIIALNVPEEELVKRLLNRGKESGRTDDQNEDVITNRIQVYEKNTAVLADFYHAQSKLENVNGIGSIDEVTNRIFSAIDN